MLLVLVMFKEVLIDIDNGGVDEVFWSRRCLRETSNIYDGSAFTADMAVQVSSKIILMKIDMTSKTMDSQNCIGDAFRGATWVSLHNGGGVGWGEVSQPPTSTSISSLSVSPSSWTW